MNLRMKKVISNFAKGVAIAFITTPKYVNLDDDIGF